MGASHQPRLKQDLPPSNADPGQFSSPVKSSFEVAASKTKPSPATLAGGDRFTKLYNVPSHGDPGHAA